MRIVLANGVFDVLHAGHILHLQEAARLGDVLVVSLTEDAHVNKGPGRPVNAWGHRALVLRELRCVDVVVPSHNCAAAIRSIRPNIFVKGIDYAEVGLLSAAREACEEVGALIHITNTPKMSSTEIIRKAMA